MTAETYGAQENRAIKKKAANRGSITVRLGEQMRSELEQVCREEGVSMSAFVKEAVGGAVLKSKSKREAPRFLPPLVGSLLGKRA
jgi:hypothetical protein